MIQTSSKSLVAAALLGLGVIAAPSFALAGDSAAKIEPVDPATLNAYGGNIPLLSSGGKLVTGDAWCDPVKGDPVKDDCLKHPWNHPKHSK